MCRLSIVEVMRRFILECPRDGGDGPGRDFILWRRHHENSRASALPVATNNQLKLYLNLLVRLLVAPCPLSVFNLLCWLWGGMEKEPLGSVCLGDSSAINAY